MRNIPVAEVDHLDRDVLAIATDYPSGYLLDWHDHRRVQLLYAATGTMRVETADGTWMVPGERAVMIPPRTRHRVLMLDVRTASLYVEPAAVPWWPGECAVVQVSGLLRELLLGAVEMEAEYAAAGRDAALVALVLHELSALSGLPLHVALPRHGVFAGLCRDYLADPALAVSNADWARAAAMSERAFTRAFRQETGTSPASWRTRARLLSAVPRLREESVTAVAASLGYASPAGFSYAFSRAFSVSPSSLRR
ncbi:AraC family transcriptional regulator [Ornithinicoccus hortensis]|uniref:Transcriptional regulator n=1 Tax=Ornithinicoccus hortensis TaxID=82346 RepID=A0A542YVM7_9MICO|nr:helix-turn-helix transcriptional regulator [Ornithinicoccus hortensis]TQL52133.1 transcriptional regulator [Ornithinicoccus hortensis]